MTACKYYLSIILNVGGKKEEKHELVCKTERTQERYGNIKKNLRVVFLQDQITERHQLQI